MNVIERIAGLWPDGFTQAGFGKGPLMRRLRSIAVWDSPTFMTWASFLTRSLGLLALLPLVLTRFSGQEVAVYLLFNVTIGLRSVADFGFTPTFVRYISYCISGARSLQDFKPSEEANPSALPNYALLGQVVGSMRQLHLWGGIATLAAFATIGTIAVSRQVNLLGDPQRGWIAWAVIVVTMGVAYWANQFAAWLQGLNHVAMLRRWEAIFNLLGASAAALVLLYGGSLLGLVITIQVWTLASCIRNAVLARRVMNGWLTRAPRRGTRESLTAVWGPAWRTGLGVAMNLGLVQLTGVFFAQLIEGERLASLLLALRLIAVVAEFSQAPFYSKLPLYSRLYSTGELTDLVRIAGRGMTLSYGAFLSGWIGLGILGPWLFRVLNTTTLFPAPELWALMGLAFLVYRFGAMHIQLYNATNHIISHVADGVSGALYVAGLLILIPAVGVMGVPLSLLVAYLGFYSWYAAKHSYRLIDTNFFQFERRAAIPALACALLYIAVVFGWPLLG